MGLLARRNLFGNAQVLGTSDSCGENSWEKEYSDG